MPIKTYKFLISFKIENLVVLFILKCTYSINLNELLDFLYAKNSLPLPLSKKQQACIWNTNVKNKMSAFNKQLLDEVEQNIVICQWRPDSLSEAMTNHDILLNLVQ